MNLRVCLLVGSAVLNAALLAAFVSRPALLPATVRELVSADDSASKAANSSSPKKVPLYSRAAKRSESSAPIWPALHSGDLTILVQRLRAAGFPPTLVRAIVDAEIERQFAPRIKELMRSMTETPYWQSDPSYYSGNSRLFEQVNQIYRERSRALRDLLGQDAYAYSGIDPTAAQRRQFGNISQAKIDLVQRINDDYAEMMGQVRSAMQGVALPEDREKLALLEREKRADLAAVLSPEELADYEMRTSQITMRLRTAFTILDANEAEFRTIFQTYEPFKDTLYPTSVGMIMYTSDTMEKRKEATTQIDAALKTALGDARFAQYKLATDSDFQQLYRLGQRDNTPYDTLLRAHDVRGTIAASSVQILDNASLSAEAKRTALKNLAQEARTKLLSTLGPTTGPAYVDNSRWLQYLDQGRGIVLQNDGSITTRSAPVSRPAATATPKG